MTKMKWAMCGKIIGDFNSVIRIVEYGRLLMVEHFIRIKGRDVKKYMVQTLNFYHYEY